MGAEPGSITYIEPGEQLVPAAHGAARKVEELNPRSAYLTTDNCATIDSWARENMVYKSVRFAALEFAHKAGGVARELAKNNPAHAAATSVKFWGLYKKSDGTIIPLLSKAVRESIYTEFHRLSVR